MPTFMIFKNARRIESIEGADPRRLSAAVKKLAEEAHRVGMDDGGEASSANGMWLGAELPRGYGDITSQVDVTGVELLNWDSALGNARTLFQGSKPNGELNHLMMRVTNAILQMTPQRRQTGLKATQMSS